MKDAIYVSLDPNFKLTISYKITLKKLDVGHKGDVNMANVSAMA